MLAGLLLAVGISVRTVAADGVCSDERIEVAMRDGVAHFVWPRARIPLHARSVSVTPDFSRAKTGERGYWVFPNNTLGTFCMSNGQVGCEHRMMPMYGMKTPRGTFCAIVKGMRYSFEPVAEAKNGSYRVSAEFIHDIDGESEDIVIDYHFLSEADADYSGIGRCYRSAQLECGGVSPIVARLKDQPLLAYAVTNIEVRIRQAWKPVPSPVLDQVAANEPAVRAVVTFDRFKDIVAESVRCGVTGAEFCLVGWNRGGHDGAYPQVFPVEPSLGGESKLREAIAYAQERGYLVVGHANFRDCYLIADTWDAEYVVEKNADGSLLRGKDAWGGGRLYTVCPQRAYERFVPKLCAEMSALGFKGLFYIDVTTSKALYPCKDPRHPMNLSQRAVWENNIMREVRRVFGGAASEGCYDFCSQNCDSGLTVQWCKPFERPKNKMVDRYVPLWQIVYHGSMLSTPFRTTINCQANPDRRFALKLAEFGGRPTFYWHSNFITGRNFGMSEDDLNATTDEKMRQSVRWMKEGCDEYARRSRLQFLFMDRHERMAEDAYRITYSDGTKMYVNYGRNPVELDGLCVPAMDYRVR